MARTDATEAPKDLRARLTLVFDWYGRMVSERTGRLVYVYDPERDLATEDGNAIRDIASIWDVEVLSHFLGRDDLAGLVERSLQHYSALLVPRDGALVVDPAKLAEPSGIAHSAFMLLALAESGLPNRDELVRGLAEGLVRQKRADGSFRTYFDADEDEGVEFYPGEAMLALMEAFRLLGDPRYLATVERAFAWFRDRMPAESVAPDLLVFFANWQSQYAAPLHARMHEDGLRRDVRDYVFALHDRILERAFYDDLARAPNAQATVEVACGLEGLCVGYTIAAREDDPKRKQAYGRGVRQALEWLGRAQRIDHATSRERGGFGHSLAERTQRIDVTGHVANGFIKAARLGLEA